MNLYQQFKAIKKGDSEGMSDFFIKNQDTAAAMAEMFSRMQGEDSIALTAGGVFDLVSVMQHVRGLDSGTYIRLTSNFVKKFGKYNFPALYSMAMTVDNNLKLAYVKDNWDKLEEKDPRAFKALNNAYVDLRRRAADYASRGFYCELQCDFVTSWTNGRPSFRHERICDFYSHPSEATAPVDSNPELIKWALLKIYEGYFITFSVLAYSYVTKSSEVMTMGFKYGILYICVNNFRGHQITCILPDLGKGVEQISGDRYLALCCPKEARTGHVRCFDAQRPILEV
jgi:hypothetical protein